MRPMMAPFSAGLLALAIAAGAGPQTPRDPAPLPSPTFTVNLGPRTACVTPQNRGLARAEGGFIDVTAADGTLTVAMTGAVAANSYLGCPGSAAESFQLVQDFEITCSDPAVKAVVLTLDSSLVGFVRGRQRAGACLRRADAVVTPAGWTNSPLAIAHPPLSVSGTGGRLCNQHLPPVEGPPMPLGRFTLVADFLIDARAAGLCDAHAVADFSPDTSLPADWVRTRDPFQGVSKRAFGFALTLTAAPAPAPGGSPFAGTVQVRPLARRDDRPTRDTRLVPASGAPLKRK